MAIHWRLGRAILGCELTILVPVYNDAENLKKNLPVIREAANGLTSSWEILVANDGSSDSTEDVVSKAAKRDRRIRMFSHKVNMGPGAGIFSGLFWARGKWVLFVPADLACKPEHLERMWYARAGADIVVGLRSDRRDYNFVRKLISVANIALIRLLSGSAVRQFNYIQMWRRSFFKGLNLRSTGVFITAEVILRAQKKKARVVQVGMEYLPREAGRGTGARPGVVIRSIWDMIAFFAFED